jgi:hypothetical protein
VLGGTLSTMPVHGGGVALLSVALAREKNPSLHPYGAYLQHIPEFITSKTRLANPKMIMLTSDSKGWRSRRFITSCQRPIASAPLSSRRSSESSGEIVSLPFIQVEPFGYPLPSGAVSF